MRDTMRTVILVVTLIVLALGVFGIVADYARLVYAAESGRPLYPMWPNERVVVECKDGVLFPRQISVSTMLLVCRGPESPLETPSLPPRPPTPVP